LENDVVSEEAVEREPDALPGHCAARALVNAVVAPPIAALHVLDR
jgi:hypothetical protein